MAKTNTATSAKPARKIVSDFDRIMNQLKRASFNNKLDKAQLELIRERCEALKHWVN